MTDNSLILRHAPDRTHKFRPNPKLDALICSLKNKLEPVQKRINSDFSVPEMPVVVVVGAPRSGTTMLTQVLAATGAFGVPTNLLSRFSYAPYIGAQIQQLLLNPEYDFGGEFSDIQQATDFASDIGKTAGALGISEFFHFWRRFFPNHDPEYLDQQQLCLVDVAGLRSELAGLQSFFGKPFMSKGMMLQYNIKFFAEQMKELKVIHIKRSPEHVMQSIYEARLRYYGTEDIWWSVKPRQFEELQKMDAFGQIAGQVLFTNHEIEEQSAYLGADRFVTVNYETLCDQPKQCLSSLASAFSMPTIVQDLTMVKDEYECSNRQRLDTKTMNELRQYYSDLQRSGTLIT